MSLCGCVWVCLCFCLLLLLLLLLLLSLLLLLLLLFAQSTGLLIMHLLNPYLDRLYTLLFRILVCF